jgi:hypothetical protein
LRDSFTIAKASLRSASSESAAPTGWARPIRITSRAGQVRVERDSAIACLSRAKEGD